MTEGNGEVRKLPKGWTWVKISEVALVNLGKTPKKSQYTDQGKYKIVKFRDVDYSGIDWFHTKDGFVSSDATYDLRELLEDDILITSSPHSSEHIGKKICYINRIPDFFDKVFL